MVPKMLKYFLLQLFVVAYGQNNSSSSSLSSLVSVSSNKPSSHSLSSLVSVSSSKPSFHSLSSLVSSSFVPPNGSLAYFIDMGTEPGVPTLIKNGVPDFSYLQDGTVERTHLYIWLNAHSPVPALQYHVWHNNFRDYLPIMKTLWSTNTFWIYPHTTGDADDTYLLINYNCKFRGREHRTVKLNVTLWFNASYDNITVEWRKTCGPDVDDGWGAASIFFFTVCILFLVLCIVGCLYNYVQHNQTGCDIIPGIGMYRSCFHRVELCFYSCFGEPRYSPQIDYDNPINDEEYNVSYQTNL